MRSLQYGYSLIELLGAMAIGAIMLVGVIAMSDSALRDTKGQQASLYQAQIVSAAGQYIQANYSDLMKTATSTAPVAINYATLTSAAAGAPYLSPNIAAKNVYGQAFCVLVSQPAAGKLDALIVGNGGQAIPDADLSNIAANSGQGGGYISNANPAVAQGSAWALSSANLKNFQSPSCLTGTTADGGHLASAIFFDGPGNLSTDFLYRDAIVGRPELNTMKTPIVLSSVQVENQPCSTTGAVSTDANGAVLSCLLGTWQRQQGHWKDPVADYVSLPLAGNSAGDVRMELLDNRAFVWDVPSNAWCALAVDQNGNLSVQQNLTVGNNATVNNNLTAANLQLTTIALRGTSCPTSGMVASDSAGGLLTCRSGTWLTPRDYNITTLAFHQAYFMDSTTGDLTANVDLTTLSGTRPLYVTGYAHCYSNESTQIIGFLQIFDAGGNSLGYLGGCGFESNPTAGAATGKGWIGLQEIPANATTLQVQIGAAKGTLDSNSGDVELYIYNSN